MMSTPKGDIYGFATPDGKIFIDPAKMNANTPVHEYGHLWLDFVKQNNKGLYSQIANLAKQTSFYDKLANNPIYSRLSDAAKAEEAAAHIIGSNGEAAFHSKSKRQTKLKQLISELWDYIAEKLGLRKNIRNLTPEQIQNMTFDQLMEGATKDIMSGKLIESAPTKELDFNLWRYTMSQEDALDESQQPTETAPVENSDADTTSQKVNEDDLFSDDPDKVREQLKLVDEDKPLTRQNKKEQKLKDKLGDGYTPPIDRTLKKELGLTTADIKKLQEENLKLKEQAEDENASEVDRKLAQLKMEQADKEIEAKFEQFQKELSAEFAEAHKADPAFKEQSEWYAAKFDKMKHTHEIQRAIMDRPDRVQLMKSLYAALDKTNPETGVNGWVYFASQKPEEQVRQLQVFLDVTGNDIQPRVQPQAPRVPQNIAHPGSGIPSESGMGDMNDPEKAMAWVQSMKKRGLL